MQLHMLSKQFLMANQKKNDVCTLYRLVVNDKNASLVYK